MLLHVALCSLPFLHFYLTFLFCFNQSNGRPVCTKYETVPHKEDCSSESVFKLCSYFYFQAIFRSLGLNECVRQRLERIQLTQQQSVPMTSASKFIYMDCVIFLKGFNRNVRLNRNIIKFFKVGTLVRFLKRYIPNFL